MNRRLTSLVIRIALLSCFFTSTGFAQVTAGQKVNTNGLILSRDGDSLTVDTKDLGKVVVSINDNTEVETPTGVVRHKGTELNSLVAGLEVSVKGVGINNGQVMASRIRFDEESLNTVHQIYAAIAATNAQVEANKQGVAENRRGIAANAPDSSQNEEIKALEKRFDELSEWDVKKDLSLTFETGKSDLSQDAQKQLVALVKEAQGLKGYLIEVKGFASTSGNPQQNQELSEDRAEAVEAFLHQQGIPLKNLVNPAAMGTTNPVASNETQEGQLQNQRVEVKLLMNRGLNSK